MQVCPSGALLTMLAMLQRRGEHAAILDFCWRAFRKVATAGSIEGSDIHQILREPAAIGTPGGER